jgi:hypothetical protein
MSGNTDKEIWGSPDEDYKQQLVEAAASAERSYEEERLLTAAAEQAEQLDGEQRMVEDATVAEANELEAEKTAEAEAETSTIPFKVVKVSESLTTVALRTFHFRFAFFSADCHRKVEEISISLNFISRRHQCVGNRTTTFGRVGAVLF